MTTALLTASAPTSAQTDEPPADPILWSAGDIGTCNTDSDEQTATLLDGTDGTVATLGDTVYESGTAREFTECYDPTWGRHKDRTRPAVGNHEYKTPGATGYYDYFGAAAGDPDKGYYSYDIGAWHIVTLNSNIPMGVGSAQLAWLEADLAANPATCTAATYHHPLFSSGSHGSDSRSLDVWRSLYTAGVDLVLNGHEHNYERFAPQDPMGGADPTGIPQFIVGTGGVARRPVGPPAPNSVIANSASWGVLKLTLRDAAFDWEFVGVPGATLNDSGTASCHAEGRELPGGGVHASDSFSRSIPSGYGAAETGGSYTHSSSPSSFTVTGTTGTLNLAPGATRGAYLRATSAHDVDLKVSVSADQPSTGGGQSAFVTARRQSAGQEYRGRARITSSGSVYVRASRISGSGAESFLGAEVRVTGLTAAAGSAIWLRAQMTGANPTTVRVRAWAAGTPEPTTWSFTAVDSTPELQGSGRVGLRAFVSSTATPAATVFSFDDFSAVEVVPTPNEPPTASFTGQCDALACSLDGTVSSDPEGALVRYDWDFGDGSSATGAAVTHRYAVAGQWQVTLTVTDAAGATASTTRVAPARDPVYPAFDSFSRTVVDRWGSADQGGTYTHLGSRSAFDVTGSQGTVTLSPGGSRGAFLGTTSVQDVDASAQVAVDRAPTGGGSYLSLTARRQSTGAEYRARLRLAADGTVLVRIARTSDTGAETQIGSERQVTGLTVGPGVPLALRFETSGANPTTLRVRAWVAGQPEPATWPLSVSDSTAALQATGAVGMRASVSSSADPGSTVFSVDDLRYRAVDRRPVT